MGKLVFGTGRFRDIVEWERICSKYNVPYIFKTKDSPYTPDETWYQLTVDIDDPTKAKYLRADIIECSKPPILRTDHFRLYSQELTHGE